MLRRERGRKIDKRTKGKEGRERRIKEQRQRQIQGQRPERERDKETASQTDGRRERAAEALWPCGRRSLCMHTYIEMLSVLSRIH